MPRPLLWKLLLILGVVAVSVFYVYPPEERIHLGLDLRGGSHILMEVDTESAVKFELDLTLTRIGQLMKDRGLRYEAIVPVGTRQFEIRGVDPGQADAVRALLQEQVSTWFVEQVEPTVWRATMPQELVQQVAQNAIETSLKTIRQRIDALGVREPLVQSQGLRGQRILIQLPGVEDPERAKNIIVDPALLEWKAVSYPPGVTDYANWFPPASREAVLQLFGGKLPDDTELVPQHIQLADGTTQTVWWPLKRVSVVVGRDLARAYRSQDRWGAPAVAFELTQEAGRRFRVATQENLGRKMAIVLGIGDDKEVISAPVIEDVIRDQGIIHGSFSIQEAEDLALKLRSGAIPAKLTIIEERTVGPSLGRDSIRAGVTAALAGFAGVLVFMLVYYRLAGLNAVVALMLNVLLVLAALGYFEATLTLPGIAGLILTIGMAVDSNVLIFERIREELRLGKTVRSAVEQGFSRAFMTILDCNVTTLVAAFFLFSYGTGPVKGFAVTLTVGLIASMFTAVFVSRQLFELVFVLRGGRVETLSI